jgi:hypothetical protein
MHAEAFSGAQRLGYLLLTGVAVEKVTPLRIAENSSRQDAQQTTLAILVGNFLSLL